MSSHKKIRLKGKIALVIVIILLAVIAIAVYVSFDNISALYKGFTMQTDDINSGIEQNKQDTADALQNAGMNISKEDLDKIDSGNLTEEEILEILQGTSSTNKGDDKDDDEEAQTPSIDQNPDIQKPIGGTPDVNAPPVNNPAENQPTGNQPIDDDNHEQTLPPAADKPIEEQNSATPTTPTKSEAEYNQKVAELVAKIYTIKSNFMSTLDSFETKIKAEYVALPEEERTTATKARIVAENMSYILSLEAQCDAQIKAVTDELSAVAKEYGKGNELVDAINQAYKNEKELKKAYYVSLYK